ncbi:TPA: hypothetical protein ACX6SR_003803 [Photobacterium damselae]
MNTFSALLWQAIKWGGVYLFLHALIFLWFGYYTVSRVPIEEFNALSMMQLRQHLQTLWHSALIGAAWGMTLPGGLWLQHKLTMNKRNHNEYESI